MNVLAIGILSPQGESAVNLQVFGSLSGKIFGSLSGKMAKVSPEKRQKPARKHVLNFLRKILNSF